MKSKNHFDPFGLELPPINSTDNRIIYTGQERDEFTNYDYMHARFYSSSIGRFLRPDPLMRSAKLEEPQSWNRYSYVENNPIAFVDPTGELISLANLTDQQKEALLEGLKEFTGNEYKVDEKGNLQLVSVGENSSTTATEFMNNAISSNITYNVYATTDQSHWGGKGTTDIYINFQTFTGANYGRVNPATFNLGSSFVHETWHAVNQLGDVDKKTGISYQNEKWQGPAVEFENKIRAERGLLQRRDYFIFNTDISGKYAKVPFYDPRKPIMVYFVEILRANAGL
ncbi:MAG: RHS repeat-associated core domain-containing protein [Thermoanaerobaculaceae bacterium]|nr:RHS repeat-associated core domain-containing protein [Thermoanaerobaculaceae bacterium]